MDHRFRGTTTRPWLDRGSHHRNRVSLGGGAPRALRRDCGRVCSSQRQRHRHDGTRSSPSKKGDIGHPDCSRVVRRPGGCWPSCESSATRWQHHWPVDAVARCCRQATRTLARGCPQFSPVGDHGQCRLSRCRAGCERGSGGGSIARPRNRQARNPASGGYRARF